ncbi:MAG TPA: DUF1844 domain-containing protein [Acidobacteriota bacterium]|nr:DUF1844 domain-containing protein [Acidobacteriota bacterium]
MNEQPDNYDVYFYQLVISLHGAAMQQMGKVASPLTDKIERDLTQARVTIDMLDMIKRKTGGNLSEDETKLLDHVLYELRMNFVEEAKKGAGPGDEAEEPSPAESQQAEKAEPKGTNPEADKDA